jgi:Flp pilus assembly protein TadG
MVRRTLEAAGRGVAETARRWRAFHRDRKGLAAVEFALILPIMISLYFGTVQIGDALTVKRKVTHVTSSLGDLVTQSKSISASDISNILDAASAVIAPYSVSNLKIVVSQIKIASDGKVTVDWSKTRNGTALIAGNTFTGLPDALKTNDSYVILASVEYAYTPYIGYMLTGTINFQKQYYLRPRISKSVACCS